MTEHRHESENTSTEDFVNNAGFYRAFEERFRGPRTLIKKRLEVYLPLVMPLLTLYQPTKVLDLGCGRGEWLELMQQRGFDVFGVDLDAGMLQACLDLDLPVCSGDAITYLQQQEDESHAVISAFHVVEHLTFEQVRQTVWQALRVLQPGGVLILETPNPDNILVATNSFYLDPSHHHPLPAQLLRFVAEFSGFERTKIMGLQEPTQIHQDGRMTLSALLGGVSPDYAVVAQKKGTKDILTLFDPAFDREYGVLLTTLLERFDGESLASSNKVEQVEQQAAQALARVDQVEQQAAQALARVDQVEQHAAQALAKADMAEQHAQMTVATLQGVYASRSWRLTAPLRQLSRTAQWFKQGVIAWLTLAPASRPRRMLSRLFAHGDLYVSRRPRLKQAIIYLLSPFPGLRQRLRSEINRNLLLLYPDTLTESSFSRSAGLRLKCDELTPRARRIYQMLNTEIESQKE